MLDDKEPFIYDHDTSKRDKGKHNPLYSLKNKNFRKLWLGMFFSINAMQMTGIASGWLVYTMTESPFALGLVSASSGIPLILFSLFGGAVADRVRKRNLLLVTQSNLCLLTIVLTALIFTDVVALWHLILASILSGLILSFNMPTRQAFIMELVKDDELTNAIALNSTAGNICRIASPAVAGVLLKLIGIPGVYCVIAVSYGIAVLSLVLIPSSKSAASKPKIALIKDVVEGLRYVKGNSILFALLIIAFVPIIAASSYITLMPVFAKSIFKAGETGFGLLLSAGGIGALCGTTLIASLGDFQRKGALMLLAGIIFGSSLFVFGLLSSLIPAMVCLFFVGGGGSMFMTLVMSLIMSNTPKDLTGRVMSIFIMTYGLMPLAGLPSGALAEVYGAPIVVSVGGGILFLFIGAIAIFQPGIRKLK
ncbi:MAG: MFS transporter [Proteobacteria bacterium]|nr:MFS transporter [Pseudomonadota bacterium]